MDSHEIILVIIGFFLGVSSCIAVQENIKNVEQQKQLVTVFLSDTVNNFSSDLYTNFLTFYSQLDRFSQIVFLVITVSFVE